MKSFLLLALMFVPLSFGLAVTNNFTVDIFVGTDTVPPTTPGTLSLTVVSENQIDVAWGSSTDDYYFGGYQVFRDSVQIATTTLINFSDTGLSPATSYTYNVVAFDAAYNYSSSSNYASATTLALTPTPTSGSRNNPIMELLDFSIKTDYFSALLTWKTSRYAQFELRWGRTEQYELGFVTNQTFSHNHQTLINGLEAGQTYQFQLISYDRSGKKGILIIDEFKTDLLADSIPPANVSNLRATRVGDDVRLSWSNPPIDFSYVRVVRNPLFFPLDPNNGFVVYQGNTESIVDVDPFYQSPIGFYSVFAYDQAGNRSSGAIIKIAATGDTPGRQVGTPNASSSYPGNYKIADEITMTNDELSLKEDMITFWQFDNLITPHGDTYVLDANGNFSVRVPADSLPRHLKTIQITFFHPIDPSISYSYLLRLNGDNQVYEAEVGDLNLRGTIDFELSVYDYVTDQVAAADGKIIIGTDSEHDEGVVIEDGPYAWFGHLFNLLTVAFAVSLLWWFFGLWRRGAGEDKPPVLN